jgi:hypothetical protein
LHHPPTFIEYLIALAYILWRHALTIKHNAAPAVDIAIEQYLRFVLCVCTNHVPR